MHHFQGKYCVENVVSYYEPLISAEERERHLYWCNFKLPIILSDRHKKFGDSYNGKTETLTSWSQFHDYDFTKYKGEQSVLKMARNLVDYEAGKTILDTAMGIMRNLNTKQQTLEL